MLLQCLNRSMMVTAPWAHVRISHRRTIAPLLQVIHAPSIDSPRALSTRRRLGDWLCPACRSNCFAATRICFQCGEARFKLGKSYNSNLKNTSKAEVKSSSKSPKLTASSITACGRDWRKALALLEAMKLDSVVPIAAHNAAMSCAGKAGKWELAINMLAKLKKSDSRSENGDNSGSGSKSSPLPNVITYNTAMSAAGKSGQWESVLEILNQMESR